MCNYIVRCICLHFSGVKFVIINYLSWIIGSSPVFIRFILLRKLEKRKQAINSEIMNLSENSRETVRRIDILIDFANRIPELYLKATLDEKRLILTTITEEITYNEDTNKLTVKLNPLFKHLRQIKLHKNESFSADLETLSGTFEKRSDSAKQTLKNDEQNLSNVVMIGTRISAINTEIEPPFESSKKQNVDGGTCLARSRLTGLRFFFSETLFLPKKRPSPSAHSR